jgi:hypothetical protein
MGKEALTQHSLELMNATTAAAGASLIKLPKKFSVTLRESHGH